MTISAYHYVFDAVPLLRDCLSKLQQAIEHETKRRQSTALYVLRDNLLSTQVLLHQYLNQVVQREREELRGFIPSHDTVDIQQALVNLEQILDEKATQEQAHRRRRRFFNPQEHEISASKEGRYSSTSSKLFPANHRSAQDTLLFRLIVALQLCLVRIDDACLVLAGRHADKMAEQNNELDQDPTRTIITRTVLSSLLGAGVAVIYARPMGTQSLSRIHSFEKWYRGSSDQLGHVALYSGLSLVMAKWIGSKWRIWWMNNRIFRSSNEIEEWVRQWKMVHESPTEESLSPRSQVEQLRQDLDRHKPGGGKKRRPPRILDDKSRRLIEYALQTDHKSSFWQSQGEVRFWMLKRFMDVYYASVGTAIGSTNPQASKASWQVPLIAGAAASFYSLTGATEKASQTVNTSSRDLIQHAWGMVSLPAIKNLMLKASRLLKGAAVADRLEICGVSCFILSKEPAPELAAALTHQRGSTVSQGPLLSSMSTISETESDTKTKSNIENEFDISQQRHFAGSCGQYRQRDVILHLTGGGFFAHTIASDLPYLLDRSAATGAVVICPEYALLPEHTFPVALEQIIEVYAALVNGVELGFEVRKVIVTGESAGGNLAAALCVRLGMQQLETENFMNKSLDSSDDVMSTETLGEEPTRMPDSLMLSCPALNLSLELSHSRVVGTSDPVLPTGLISAISDAYIPKECGSKQNPLASPFFAPDAVLRRFPPTLLLAGSNDPLLDDSVDFNKRLRSCGVESELRAAQNLPHAYLGLGTAGFPEARQVQEKCQEWMKRQLLR